MAQKRIVHLRVYRGRELNYDANGKVKNENHKVSLTHQTVEWANYLKNLRNNGFAKVEVVDVLEGSGSNYESVDASEIKEEVAQAFEPKTEVVLTPDQKRIADLERMVKELSEPKKPTKKKVETPVVIPSLPKGKSLEDLKRGQLNELFPNVADLEPANKADFIELVHKTYPNQYK